MAKVFKIFADFYTGILENIYNMLDSFDGLGGELFAKLKEAIGDHDTMVVAQIAPSVRVGLSGQLGFTKDENAMARIVGGLKKLGIDHVVDTVFSADLTVIEEGNEFLERLTKGGKLPLLTSCCPAWVKFCEEQFPDYAGNISTCRSPQQMLGAVLRKWYERPENSKGKRVFSISIMPCTAKKAEILRPESKTDGRQDVDLSLTTTELAQMFEEAGINRSNCPVGVADVPFSMGSGGAMKCAVLHPELYGGALIMSGGGMTVPMPAPAVPAAAPAGRPSMPAAATAAERGCG